MAARKVKWTLRAINDKLAIYAYWTNRNGSSVYAAKLETFFERALAQSAEFPTSGKKTDVKDVRVLIIRHFKIFYSFDVGTVTVLAVFDTRRFPDKLRL